MYDIIKYLLFMSLGSVVLEDPPFLRAACIYRSWWVSTSTWTESLLPVRAVTNILANTLYRFKLPVLDVICSINCGS